MLIKTECREQKNMTMELESKAIDNDTIIIQIKGEVDMESAPSLQKQLVDHFRKNIKIVIVDLSAVSYIDSSGIATFVEGLQWSHNTQNKFRLVGLVPRVKDIFDIARLTTVFEIFDTPEKAMEDLA